MREEYKLIFLTLLVRLGLGTLVVYIVTSPWLPPLSETFVTLAALVTTCTGLGLSLLHVGRPGRILNTLSNRKSAMSWEAILAPLMLSAVGLLVLFSYFYPASSWLSGLRMVVLFLAIAFIFVTGKVYHLRARPSWNTPLVLYEYFISAFIMGLLGLAFVCYATESMTIPLGRFFGYALLPLLFAETIITYAYRVRAMRVTTTARNALKTASARRLYIFFVVFGLMTPLALAIALSLGIDLSVIVPVALGTFLLGAGMWRVIFFRSATLIKITPDIDI